jgi:hypothetical protein
MTLLREKSTVARPKEVKTGYGVTESINLTKSYKEGYGSKKKLFFQR